MKKVLVVLALTALFLPTLAAADSWTGWITDDHCGAKGAKAEHASCAKKCLDQGGKLVFFNSADQKLYNLDNQKLAEEHLGHEVVVTGTVDGNDIKVESIAMPAAK
ncbi:MAG TPA: DUF5818 domain-containing protein [Thermoanaerobaculia bacterium]|jgi:hypothetical protein|nr:DUF5818 domain-containing protein [Thermoanaerobaculia bacterium]